MQNYDLLYRKRKGIFYYFKMIYSRIIVPSLLLLFAILNVVLFVSILKWKESNKF